MGYDIENGFYDQYDGSCAHKFLENLEEFHFGDLSVPIFIDSLNKLTDLIVFDLSVSSETPEGIVNKLKDLISLESA